MVENRARFLPAFLRWQNNCHLIFYNEQRKRKFSAEVVEVRPPKARSVPEIQARFFSGLSRCMIFDHIFLNGDRKTGTFSKYVAGSQAVSPRSPLGTCNVLHGVAEKQARFPKECLKIIHLTRFRWSNFRHPKARFRKRGRKSGTKSKKVAVIQPSPRDGWLKTLHSTQVAWSNFRHSKARL